MKTDLLRGTREKLRTGIIDKTMTHETRIAELERTPTTGSVQVERQIISAGGGGGGGSVSISYATTAEIADVTTTEAAGTSSLVARGDHVHAHSQLNTGDLHQDYILAAGTRALSGDWSAGDGRTITVGKVVAGYIGDQTRLAMQGYGGVIWSVTDPSLGPSSGDGFAVSQTYTAAASVNDNKALYVTLALTAASGSSAHPHAGLGALLRVDDFARTYSGEPSAIRAIAAVIAASGTYAQLTVQRFEANNSGSGGTVTSTYLAHFFPLQGTGSTAFETFKAIVIDNIGTGITTLSVGIEIAAQSGPTTAIGVRNAATTRLVDAVTVGADAAVTSGQIMSVTGSVGISGYERVGSLTAPTNTTAGDLTATRLIVPNAAIVHSAISQLGGPVVIPAAGALRFSDSDNSHYTALKANDTTTATVTYSLPAADGSSNQVLTTNGSGTLSWTTAAGGGGTLDTAYDFGGAGSGKTINADSGPVTIQPTGAMADPTTAGLLWVKDMILVEAYNYTTDVADTTMQAATFKGQVNIVTTNPNDNGHGGDAFWVDLTSSASLTSNDNKAIFGTIYLTATSGTSNSHHAGVRGNMVLGGTIAYANDATFGHPVSALTGTVIVGYGGASSGTVTSAAGMVLDARTSIQAGDNKTLTTAYLLYLGNKYDGTYGTITNYVGIYQADLSGGSTNYYGMQLGSAGKGSWINHKLKLGAASEATAGYILDVNGAITVAGNTTWTSGNLTVSAGTVDITGVTSIKAANDFRMYDSDNTQYVAMKAAATASLTTSFTWVLPFDTPSAGEVLKVTSYAAGTINLEWAADNTGTGALPISSNTQLASAAAFLYVDTASSGIQFYDSRKLMFGTGSGIGTGDAEIYYDGTDLIVEPNAIGTGGVKVNGTMALGTASVANTILIRGTLTTDNDSFSGVSAVLNYSNTASGGFVLSNANQYQLNIQNVTAGSSVAPTAMYLEFNYKNTISNSATLGGNGLAIVFDNASSYGLAAQVGIQISLTATGTGRSDLARAIFIADPSAVGTTGDIVYGLHMDNFNASTSPTRWPFYYGDAGSPYFTIDHNANTYIKGTLEVDGATQHDGAVTCNSTLTVAASQLSTFNGDLKASALTAFTSSTATVSGAGSTITPTTTYVKVNNTSGGSVTLNDPCIANGTYDGQIIILRNISAQNVVFTDGRNVQLPFGSAITLGPDDVIGFIWEAATADWWVWTNQAFT